jgi:hypothetical protein
MDELSIEPIAGEEAATISMSEVHLQQESRDADRRTCIRCVWTAGVERSCESIDAITCWNCRPSRISTPYSTASCSASFSHASARKSATPKLRSPLKVFSEQYLTTDTPQFYGWTAVREGEKDAWSRQNLRQRARGICRGFRLCPDQLVRHHRVASHQRLFTQNVRRQRLKSDRWTCWLLAWTSREID